MKAQGRTQKWLAERLGKSENTISQWAQNKIQPSVDDLFKIAKELNVKAKDLINEN